MRNKNLQLVGLSGLILGLAGCHYVTTSERTNQLNCLDQDGDGAVAAADLCDQEGVIDDCNDSPQLGANETPGAEEIPYDGWDNDCGRLNNEQQPDLVDVDGDGYPGILKSDWEQIASSTVSWPGGLRETIDCDDNAADVNPSAVDRPYDGIDSDCQGDDDYDRDDDGFVPDPVDIENEPGYVPYEGDKPAGDCNDFSGQFYPGAEDAPYDGEDRDCAGDDDYDADGDGHRSAAQVGTGTDCDDGDATINPDANDAPYDGIDSDCDNKDDFDQDEDGVIPPQYESTYTSYSSETWYLNLVSGDCDDTNPDVYPGKLEIFLDGIDQDCDGGEGATFGSPEEHGVIGPRRPDVRTRNGEFIVSIAGDEVSNRIGEVQQGGMALWFPDSSLPGEQPQREQRWKANGSILLNGNPSFEATQDALAWGYNGTLSAGTSNESYALIISYATEGLDDMPAVKPVLYNVGASVGTFGEASDVIIDGTNIYAASCGTDRAMYGWIDLNNPLTSAPNQSANEPAPCDQMLVGSWGGSVGMHKVSGNANASFKLASSAITSSTARYSLSGVASMRSHSGLGVIGLAGGGVVIDDGSTSSTHLSGYKIIEADAVEVGGIFYIAAIVNDGGSAEIVLAEIDGSNETVADMVWPDSFDPVGVSLDISSNRMMVVAVGDNGTASGSIHYAFLDL